MKIVIANTPGIDGHGKAIVHSPSRWTNSYADRNVFTYYPWELAYLSSLLKQKTDHEVRFVDGCLWKMEHEAYFKLIADENPDWLVMESATRTINEDLRLALRLKKECGTKLIFTGQHPMAHPEDVLAGRMQKRPWEDRLPYEGLGVDHVCIGEYEMTVLDLLTGKDPADIPGLHPNGYRQLLNVNELPWPEDTDIGRIEYCYPPEMSSAYTEIQFYTSRSCPIHCSFCVTGNTYYVRPNWRKRGTGDIVAEIAHLKSKYPAMEGCFFDEEIHNIGKKFILDLSKEIKRAGLDKLHYNAMCGMWTMDREMLEAMKDAGYYFVRFGVETASEKVAEGMTLGPKFNVPKLWQILRDAREIGLTMYGTFSMGGKFSTREEDMKTARLIEELVGEGLMSRLQISINTPQPGTPFYEWCRENGYLSTDQWDEFDGGNIVVANYPHYPKDDVLEMVREAHRAYDRGMKKHTSETVSRKVRDFFQGKKGLKKVLIIRSSRMWHFDAVTQGIEQALDSAELSTLVQPSVRGEINGHFRKIIEYREHDYFEVTRFPADLLQTLRGEHYDLVVVPYSNPTGNGYEQVELIAHLIRGRNAISIGVDGDIYRLNPISKTRA